MKNMHTFVFFFLCAFPNRPGYSWFCRGESVFLWQMATLARPLAPSQKNMMASVQLPSRNECLFFVMYVTSEIDVSPTNNMNKIFYFYMTVCRNNQSLILELYISLVVSFIIPLFLVWSVIDLCCYCYVVIYITVSHKFTWDECHGK